MRRRIGIGIALLMAILIFTGASDSTRDPLDQALSGIGLTRTSFRVADAFWSGRTHSPHKLPMFDQWFLHPTTIPFWEQLWRDGFVSAKGNSHTLYGTVSGAIGVATRRDLISPTPLERYQMEATRAEPLLQGIQRIDSNASVPDISKIPLPLQSITTTILFAIAEAVDRRTVAFRQLTQAECEFLYRSLSEPLEPLLRDRDTTIQLPEAVEWDTFSRTMDCLDRVDWKPLFSGADDLTAVLEAACDSLRKLPQMNAFYVSIPTKLGSIILSNGRDDHYSEAAPLLIIDLSGNDEYNTGGATTSFKYPASILLDVNGNDRYTSTQKAASFGAGILGWGMLYDLAGNDRYDSRGYFSQGAGCGGVGVLVDRKGNDHYDAVGSTQGFGYFGVGILCDDSGNDSYHGYVQCQGCGMPKGFGVLADYDGDDHYNADDVDIQVASAQTKEHNSNMSQGAGCGFRRDFMDGKSIAGGVGWLFDAKGNDTYFGGVFTQAVGYWYGIGVLDDGAGDDTYRGVWYNQSATAHFGISALVDRGGNDKYESLMTMSMGAAHDFSVSIFLEQTGSDQYYPKANAVGKSLNSSFALFVDQAGDDEYSTGSDCGDSRNDSKFGIRAAMTTAALFFDLSGSDRYSSEHLRNNTTKFRSEIDSLPDLRSGFFDQHQSTIHWKSNE